MKSDLGLLGQIQSNQGSSADLVPLDPAMSQ